MTNVDSFEQLLRILGTAESVVAIGHIRPDGDALGSAVAVALAARNQGMEGYVTFGEPFTMPNQFRYLDTSMVVTPEAVPGDLDVAVACDTATIERLGTAIKVAESAKQMIVIDHHVSNEGFGDVRYVDPNAAATAEMVYRVITALGWKITQEIGAALYTGLVTDTGRFQYSVTTPEVHRMVADLLAVGVKPEEIGRHIYEESPFGYLGVAGAVLSRARLESDVGLVWSLVGEADVAGGGIGFDQIDGLIDLIRVAQEADVACLLKSRHGIVNGSLRSRGEVDVGAIAATFGGGGHHNASGFTSELTPEAVIGLIKGQLSESPDR